MLSLKMTNIGLTFPRRVWCHIFCLAKGLALGVRGILDSWKGIRADDIGAIVLCLKKENDYTFM